MQIMMNDQDRLAQIALLAKQRSISVAATGTTADMSTSQRVA
jgi:hypothetical protein